MEKKTNYLLLIGLLFLAFTNTFGQTTISELDKLLEDIIDGSWDIEHRGSWVVSEELEGGDNINANPEIIKIIDRTIEFKNGTYILDSGKTGKYTFEESRLYLDGRECVFTVYDKDQFRLITFIDWNLYFTYMLTRRNGK